MAIPANMIHLVDKPFLLDLADATILDGSGNLRLPNNRHNFSLTLSGNETIGNLLTAKREGRIIRFFNVGANTATFTSATFSGAIEGATTNGLTAVAAGDSITFQQLSGGNWIQIAGSNN